MLSIILTSKAEKEHQHLFHYAKWAPFLGDEIEPCHVVER